MNQQTRKMKELTPDVLDAILHLQSAYKHVVNTGPIDVQALRLLTDLQTKVLYH